MPRYASYATRMPGLVTLADRKPFVARLIKRTIGFAPERSLPQFKRSFLSSAVTRPTASAKTKEVLLFVDTFNNSSKPENARAAQLVEAAGYTVHFNTPEGERPVCCGHTFLAAGLIDEARAEAQRMLQTFMPFVPLCSDLHNVVPILPGVAPTLARANCRRGLL